MKVGVIGSNTIEDKEGVYKLLKEAVGEKVVFLGQGGKGVAKFVKDFANENKIDFVEFQPYHLIDNKASFSSKYFFLRTKQIVDNSDIVLAIWNGDCKEVEYGIKYAQKKKVPISIVKTIKNS